MVKGKTGREKRAAARSGRDRTFGSFLRERGYLIAAILAALASVVTFDPKLYINGDNVSYIFLGQDILAGDLWPSPKFPPGFPLLLAPVQLFFGTALLPQKILVFAFYLGSVFFLARIFRRRLDSTFGPAALFVAATLVPVIEYSHYVMSEIPFLFFLLGAFDAVERLFETEASSGFRKALGKKVVWGIALWIAAAFYIRSAGIAAGAGIGLAFLLSRRFSEAWALAFCFLCLALPWMIHSLTTEGGNPYFDQLVRVNPYYPEFGTLDAAGWWTRIEFNLEAYFRHLVPSTVVGVPYKSTYSIPAMQRLPQPIFFALPTMVLLVLGAVREIRRRDPIAIALATSLIMILAWPPIWAANRFLIPLAPLLFLVFWRGLSWIGEIPRFSGLRWISGVILCPLVVLALINLDNYQFETAEYPVVWANYFESLDWVRENTETNVVVIDRKPGFVRYAAERTAYSFPREFDPDKMLDDFRAKSADLVLLNQLPYDDISRYLEPALNARTDYFTILFRKLDPNPDPALNGSCYVLVFKDSPRIPTRAPTQTP